MDSKTTQVINLSQADVASAVSAWVEAKFGHRGKWTIVIDTERHEVPGGDWNGPPLYNHTVKATAKRAVDDSEVR